MAERFIDMLDDLQVRLQGDSFWENYLKDPTKFSLHLAILVEPYLQYILDGRKTVESRFSAMRCAPYGSVSKGDIVLLKRSSGPIVGLCQVASVLFCGQIHSASLQFIRDTYSAAICAQDDAFWEARQTASYATLMEIAHVKAVEPIAFPKRDRRGWVVLQAALSDKQLSLNL